MRSRWLLWLLVALVVLGAGGGATVAAFQAKDAADFALRWWRAFDGLGLGTSARLLAVAHAASESGWGKGKAARAGNNPWNITRTPTEPGLVVAGGDREPAPLGSAKDLNDGKADGWTNITQRFAAWSTPEEAARSYLAFLARPRYAAHDVLGALRSGDAARFARQLKAAGYYTAPEDEYRTSLTKVVASVASRIPANLRAA